MSSSVGGVLLRILLVCGIALPVSNFATRGLAQEFQARLSTKQKSMVEVQLDRHALVGVAKSQLGPPAAVKNEPALRFAGAVTARREKDRNIGSDRSSDQSPTDDVLLSSAAKVSIKAYKYPELTGDYHINADQTISIPALGRIKVQNLTPADLETKVIEKLEKMIGIRTHVTIEVSEYHPIFVSGYVGEPGSFTWKPGMTVLQAEALGGGLYRPPQSQNGLSRFAAEVFAVKRISEIKSITDDLKRTLAIRARAYAERDNLAQIEVPQRLVELLGRHEAQALIDLETNLLRSRRVAIESQKARLDQASVVASKELAALEEQQELLKKQIKIRSEHLDLLKGAGSRGSVRRVIVLDAESRLSDLQEKTTYSVAASARVRTKVIELKGEGERLIQERQLALAKEIEQLERNAARMVIELAAARESYATLKRHRYVSEHDDNGSVVDYEIMRWENGKIVTISADRSTLLSAGDILTVKVRSLAGSGISTQ